MRRIRVTGGHTDGDGVRASSRDHDALPPGRSREEEAILIAERLSALVESRRAGSPSAAPGAPRVEATIAGAPGRVVGARHTGRLLGNLLLNRGFIVESELKYALARQADTGAPIGQILVDLGLITDRDLVELLAEQLRMHVVDLARVDCDRAVLRLLTRDDAHRLAAVPMRRVDGHIDVAIADPSNDDAVYELQKSLGAPLRLLLATRADIDAAVGRFYR